MEKWKSVPEWKNYEVSNLGNVKSLNYNKTGKSKLLIQSTTVYGYCQVNLSYNKKRKTIKVHQLVAMAFLGHIRNGNRIVIDHIDNNKLNNKLDNLQLISNYNNCNKIIRGNSKYIGVSKQLNRWRAYININGKKNFIGSFINEYDAHLAYQYALSQSSIEL